MMSRQARWPGVVMGFDIHMIAGSRACSTFSPAHSTQHHQPDKPELCRGPGFPGGRTLRHSARTVHRGGMSDANSNKPAAGRLRRSQRPPFSYQIRLTGARPVVVFNGSRSRRLPRCCRDSPTQSWSAESRSGSGSSRQRLATSVYFAGRVLSAL